MNRRTGSLLFTAMLCAALFVPPVAAQDAKPMELLKPKMEGGMPLMQALRTRQSTRAFSPEKLQPQMLSDLLWAAFGINRPDSGRRTAPSAKNFQEIDIYVAMAEGVYLYDAQKHVLVPVTQTDVREAATTQAYAKDAPVHLLYVADYSKMKDTPDETKLLFAGADTGFISQNVYLFCASEGLATVVRAGMDKPALTKTLGLGENRRLILEQPVGLPKK